MEHPVRQPVSVETPAHRLTATHPTCPPDTKDPQEQADTEVGPSTTPKSRHASETRRTTELNSASPADRWIEAKAPVGRPSPIAAHERNRGPPEQRAEGIQRILHGAPPPTGSSGSTMMRSWIRTGRTNSSSPSTHKLSDPSANGATGVSTGDSCVLTSVPRCSCPSSPHSSRRGPGSQLDRARGECPRLQVLVGLGCRRHRCMTEQPLNYLGRDSPPEQARGVGVAKCVG